MTTAAPRRAPLLALIVGFLVGGLFACGLLSLWLTVGAGVERLPPALQTAVGSVRIRFSGQPTGVAQKQGVSQGTQPAATSTETPACPTELVFDSIVGGCVEVTPSALLGSATATPSCPPGSVFDPTPSVCVPGTASPGTPSAGDVALTLTALATQIPNNTPIAIPSAFATYADPYLP
jgi:hypothetical protein